MWRPWVRYRGDVENAARERQEAEREPEAARERRRAAEIQVAVSQQITDALHREIERNGWTELLQKAWGGR
jgi:hypothetical protein